MLGCGNGVSLSIVKGERALRGCATHLVAKSRYKLSGISMNPDGWIYMTVQSSTVTLSPVC